MLSAGNRTRNASLAGRRRTRVVANLAVDCNSGCTSGSASLLRRYQAQARYLPGWMADCRGRLAGLAGRFSLRFKNRFTCVGMLTVCCTCLFILRDTLVLHSTANSVEHRRLYMRKLTLILRIEFICSYNNRMCFTFSPLSLMFPWCIYLRCKQSWLVIK